MKKKHFALNIIACGLNNLNKWTFDHWKNYLWPFKICVWVTLDTLKLEAIVLLWIYANPWFPGGARRVGRCVLSISHFPRKLVEGAGTSQNKATLPNLEICKRNKDYFFCLEWLWRWTESCLYLSGMDFHEDLSQLGEKEGLKGQKMSKAVESFTWNITVLKVIIAAFFSSNY